jgi:hypothetical protein
MGSKKYNWLLILFFLSLVLGACNPIVTAQETEPVASQTLEDLQANEEFNIETVIVTEEATATTTITPTIAPTLTATPSPTPTPTLSPEEVAAAIQADIRDEILSYGINLDDLANSKNEWARNHKAIDSIQAYLDHDNFNREQEGSPRTVMLDIEGVKTQKEFDLALVTDGGWKILSYAKIAYKMANGDWQIIKVPLSAYNEEDDVLWEKYPGTIMGQIIHDGEDKERKFRVMELVPEEGMARLWTLINLIWNYHSGTGSFITLFTGWVEDPRLANNDCVLGDPPRYSEEDLIYFRETGDPSIFGYKDNWGHYIFWPIVSFNANLSEIDHYDTQAIIENKYYDVGEWVIQEDAWLRIKEYKISRSGTLEIYIEIRNRLPDNLLFSWNPVTSFTMTDNTGHNYDFSERYEIDDLDDEVIDGYWSMDILWKGTLATLSFTDEAFLSDSVITLYLNVEEFSVFENVKFKIRIR